MRFLAIDDDVTVLKAIEVAVRLRRPQWRVDSLLDPSELKERLRTTQYDVILSDISMPQINGLTVLQHVKDAGLLTPVVFLTGYRQQYESAAWELGAFGVLDKPIDVNLLIETLEAAALCRMPPESKN